MSSRSELSVTACFAVHAEADPSVMPRVLEQFAKRGLVPTRWHSSLAGSRDEELLIDIQMAGLAPALTARIAELLRGQVRVRQVLTSEKRAAEVA